MSTSSPRFSSTWPAPQLALQSCVSLEPVWTWRQIENHGNRPCGHFSLMPLYCTESCRLFWKENFSDQCKTYSRYSIYIYIYIHRNIANLSVALYPIYNEYDNDIIWKELRLCLKHCLPVQMYAITLQRCYNMVRCHWFPLFANMERWITIVISIQHGNKGPVWCCG